jgi:mannobiose 2-epimerase
VRDRVTAEEGYLSLFFQPDWTPVPDHDSFGHDVETAFLLLEAAETLGLKRDVRTEKVARSLVDHAMKYGWDKANGGFVLDCNPGSVTQSMLRSLRLRLCTNCFRGKRSR